MTKEENKPQHYLKTMAHPSDPYSGRLDYDRIIAHLLTASASGDLWTRIAVSRDTQPGKRLKRRRALTNFINDIEVFNQPLRPGADGESYGYYIWARIEPQKN